MVRCLTRRFLPEYATGCDACHTYQTTIDNETVRMEIIDCSKNVSNLKKREIINYEQLCTVMYIKNHSWGPPIFDIYLS